MTWQRLREILRRDGWLLAVMGLCAAICLILGAWDGTSPTEESRLSRVLSAMEGAGQVEVAIYYDADAVPCGALVVADGAASVSVQLRLTSAVATLLGLDADCVAVYPRNAEQ